MCVTKCSEVYRIFCVQKNHAKRNNYIYCQNHAEHILGILLNM